MLEYDDTAFFFFALSTISCYALPSWISVVRSITRAIWTKDTEIGAIARTSVENSKADQIRKSNKGITKLTSATFMVNLSLTILASAIICYLVKSMPQHADIDSYDPWKILNVDHGAAEEIIKKAYKNLAKIYHPDKCPTCTEMFLKIKKAHDCLTDPVGKKNCAEFGDPDGKQRLTFGIGLPTLLLDPGNYNLVLMVYLLIVVLIIPAAVHKYYSLSRKFGQKNVMYDTYAWFHHSLSEHMLVNSLPETFAGSAEFREHNLPKTDNERGELSKVVSSLKSKMQKPKTNHPILLKGNVLMHAHLHRTMDILPDTLKKDLNLMLRYSNSLVEAMIGICQNQDWLQAALKCIQFGQYVTQGCWTKDSSLLQLPHFTKEGVKHCQKGKSRKTGNLQEYLNVPDDQKKGLANMTQTQKDDVLKCCSLIPRLDIESKVFVDDDEDANVHEGDLLTIQVMMTRTNLEEGEKAGLVHAPHFPFPKQEAWWVILGTKDGKIIWIRKVVDPSRVVRHDIKFLAPKAGEYEFDLHVMSNDYIGLDQRQQVNLVTLSSSNLPEYKVHPDDARLDDEPTLFEEMLNANVEDHSDSDEDEDDDDDDDETENAGNSVLSATEMMRLSRNTEAVADDIDESDDDSEV